MKPTIKRYALIVGASSFLGLLSLSSGKAGEFVNEQTFSFGRLVILSSPTPTSITIQPDGQITKDNNILVVEPGFPARFRMVNFPRNTHFTYSIVVANRVGPFDLTVTPSSGDGWFLSDGSYPVSNVGAIDVGMTLTAPANTYFHNNIYSWTIYVGVIVNH